MQVTRAPKPPPPPVVLELNERDIVVLRTLLTWRAVSVEAYDRRPGARNRGEPTAGTINSWCGELLRAINSLSLAE